MSWTSLPGQRTTTSPSGRDPNTQGLPMDPLKMAAAQEQVAFAARGALDTPGHIREAKQYIRTVLDLQMKENRYGRATFLPLTAVKSRGEFPDRKALSEEELWRHGSKQKQVVIEKGRTVRKDLVFDEGSARLYWTETSAGTPQGYSQRD